MSTPTTEATMCSTPTVETLTDILGAEFWTVGFPTAAAANTHAAMRMDEGREAVTWTDAEGHDWCAYGHRSAEAVAASDALFTDAMGEGVGVVEALRRMAGMA